MEIINKTAVFTHPEEIDDKDMAYVNLPKKRRMLSEEECKEAEDSSSSVDDEEEEQPANSPPPLACEEAPPEPDQVVIRKDYNPKAQEMKRYDVDVMIKNIEETQDILVRLVNDHSKLELELSKCKEDNIDLSRENKYLNDQHKKDTDEIRELKKELEELRDRLAKASVALKD